MNARIMTAAMLAAASTASAQSLYEIGRPDSDAIRGTSDRKSVV